MYHDPITEIDVLYRNFDGLDVAFQGRIPDALEKVLATAKEKAQEEKQAVLIEFRGHKMHVGEGGLKGGYAYRCDTGPDGATWFFKKPNGKDPWGIRVSVKALSLALYGLGGTRARIYEFLEGIGAALAHQGESIGRVDYAVDLILPDFVLDPEDMVMHSSMSRSDNKEPELMRINGKSGRYTSTTAGTMPGRQVIIYDKQAEVTQKKKIYWWRIWNDWRRASGYPELNRHDMDGKRIWRVEIRAGKDYLKKGKDHLGRRWDITTWEDLDRLLGDVLVKTLKDVRYTVQSHGVNRSRRDNHPVWDAVLREVKDDLFEMTCPVDERVIKSIIREHKVAELEQQVIGLTASLAAASGVEETEVEELPAIMEVLLREAIDRNVPEFVKKMRRAQERYTFLE